MSNWRQNQPKDRARATEMAAAYLGGETLQSIADRYGVSRERVRQICTQQGVKKSTIPKTARFVPLDKQDPRWRYAWSSAGAWWWKHHHQTKVKRRQQVAKVRAWVAKMGRTNPTNQELARIIGEPSIQNAAYLWGRGFGKPYTKYLDRLRKLGGIVARGRGYRGHINPQSRKGWRTTASLAFDVDVRHLLEIGCNYREIAKILQRSRSGVYNAIRRIQGEVK